MARFKVHIEYEGTRYSGWQVQKNARTVQGELLEAAQKVFDTHQVEFYGAGRTDAGVHALCQVAHLDVQTMLGPEIIRMKINDELPADINILEIEKAPKTFHARHDAVARSSVYQISRRRTAFAKRYVWWVKDRLELSKMEMAAKCFVGMKNFESFTADDPEQKSTEVFIETIQLKQAGELVLIRISGSHFLWKMVRQMVGILAEVGRGNLTPAQVSGFLKVKSDMPAKFTAPPSGLFLEHVYYKGDARNRPLVPVMEVGRGV
jgi:tRNA pseudouridine38-40 synthase